MDPQANRETNTEMKEEMVPAFVFSTDIPSFPTKYRLKKPLSRLSLATDRFSCVSFLTSSHRSDLSCSWLPRWRSLPNDLQEEEHFHSGDADGFDLLKPSSNYRITNMSRRYKTMDYINVMVEEEADDVVYSGGAGACDLSTIVGLSVSRDFLDCGIENSIDGGSGIMAHSSSDEHLHCSGASEYDAAKQHLTEANVNYALASSRTCSSEHLDPGHRNTRKIEQWLQRCYLRPSQDELNVPCGNKL